MQIKRIIVLATLLMIGFVSGAAVAATNMEKVEAFLRRDFTVYVDGQKTDVDQVLVYNNTSYLPLRKIGELLGAEVVCNEKNQGIFVTPRIYSQQDPAHNPDIASITMTSVEGYNVTYLGKQVPVLAIRTNDYTMGLYYRVSDIKELQINLNGLQLAEESRTKELYVSEKELAKAWKETPTFAYAYDKLITGKIEKEQLEVLETYIKDLPEMYKAMKMKDPVYPEMDYNPMVHIYTIDALPNNEFNILGIESAVSNTYFIRYWIKLDKNALDKWYRKEEKITNLGPMYSQSYYPRY